MAKKKKFDAQGTADVIIEAIYQAVEELEPADYADVLAVLRKDYDGRVDCLRDEQGDEFVEEHELA